MCWRRSSTRSRSLSHRVHAARHRRPQYQRNRRRAGTRRRSREDPSAPRARHDPARRDACESAKWPPARSSSTPRAAIASCRRCWRGCPGLAGRPVSPTPTARSSRPAAIRGRARQACHLSIPRFTPMTRQGDQEEPTCDSSASRHSSLALALTFVLSGFGPAVTAQQLAGHSQMDETAQSHLPLRHLRRRAVLDRRAADARSHCDRRSGDGAGGGSQGRCRGLAAEDHRRASGRTGRSDRPRRDHRIAAAERGRGSPGARSTRRASSPASASPAPSATPRSTTPSRRESAGGWTDGRTPI